LTKAGFLLLQAEHYAKIFIKQEIYSLDQLAYLSEDDICKLLNNMSAGAKINVRRLKDNISQGAFCFISF
jgi:chromosome condensin MukBEF MukE localization factor